MQKLVLPITLFLVVFNWSNLRTASAQEFTRANSRTANLTNKQLNQKLNRSVSVNKKSFNIPFKLEAKDQERIVEVLLFESRDRGRSWQLHSRQNPKASNFPYQCENDGEFWFAVRSEDRDGRTIPSGQLFPELKITVDTRKPDLEFNIRPDAAGRVVGVWRAGDANLDFSSLRISYQNPYQNQWRQVPATRYDGKGSVFENQIAFWPEIEGQQLRVRAEIRDKAGNLTFVEREITIPMVAALPKRQANLNTGHVKPPIQHTALPEAGSPGLPKREGLPNSEDETKTRFASNRTQTKLEQGTVFGEPPPNPGNYKNETRSQVWPSETQEQQRSRVTSATTFDGNWQSRSGQVIDRNDDGMVVTEGSTLNRTVDGYSRQPNQGDSAKSNTSFASSTTGNNDSGPVAAQSAVYKAIGGSARPINSTRFNLDYEIDAVGPSGVKDVVLWATVDGGRTWKSWSVDQDKVSPFKVEVPSDGIYGFRIVISSNDGLRGRAPRPNEQADVWIRVDTKEPDALITSAPYGQSTEVGKLIINWAADDDALTLRPITLQYSRGPSGPWTTIESGLRNEGRFVWKPELQTPDQVYLRMEARDTAGNVGIYQTDQPVDISGLKPRGHIRDVRPIGTGS